LLIRFAPGGGIVFASINEAWICQLGMPCLAQHLVMPEAALPHA
jgi:hypothetical protein